LKSAIELFQPSGYSGKNNTASRAGGCIFKTKAVYLPMKVKTAAPRAKMAVKMPKKDMLDRK
jgi:hypothetical protein